MKVVVVCSPYRGTEEEVREKVRTMLPPLQADAVIALVQVELIGGPGAVGERQHIPSGIIFEFDGLERIKGDDAVDIHAAAGNR